MFRRITLALVSLAIAGCTSAPVRTTASAAARPAIQKMSLEDIFLDDSEEKLGDTYQAETFRPYDPSGDSATH